MSPDTARVLLTGACGGIGQASAQALLRAGAAVMISGRSPARLAAQARAWRQQFRVTGAQLHWCAVDLTHPDAAHDLAVAASHWGANTVVHAAGVPAFGRLQAQQPAQVAEAVQLNLLAPMLLTQALLPHLLAQPRAQVLFVGSALGRLGLPGFSVYSAAKFGLRGFAQALRRELRGSPVSVHYLGPRTTRTAFNAPQVQAYNAATRAAQDEPSRVAAALLNQLRDETAERFIGWPERVAGVLNAVAPAWLDPVFDTHRRSLPMAEQPTPEPADAVADRAGLNPAPVGQLPHTVPLHSHLSKELS